MPRTIRAYTVLARLGDHLEKLRAQRLTRALKPFRRGIAANPRGLGNLAHRSALKTLAPEPARRGRQDRISAREWVVLLLCHAVYYII